MHMRTTLAAMGLAAGSLALGGCDALVDKDSWHAEIDEQCRAGFAAGSEDNAQVFCDCQDAKIREADLGPMDMMDEQVMRDISDACGEEVMNAMREDWNL